MNPKVNHPQARVDGDSIELTFSSKDERVFTLLTTGGLPNLRIYCSDWERGDFGKSLTSVLIATNFGSGWEHYPYPGDLSEALYPVAGVFPIYAGDVPIDSAYPPHCDDEGRHHFSPSMFDHSGNHGSIEWGESLIRRFAGQFAVTVSADPQQKWVRVRIEPWREGMQDGTRFELEDPTNPFTWDPWDIDPDREYGIMIKKCGF